MKILRHILLVLSVIAFGSCEKNIIDDSDKIVPGQDFELSETTENYDITYKFNDSVIVLTEKIQQHLVKVEDDSILYFSKSMPKEKMPKVGSIISSKITDLTPYGLGNVVLERTEVGGLIRCVTTVAPLDDIFEELELTSNFSLTDLINDTTGFYDDEGNYYEIEIKEAEYFTDSITDTLETNPIQTRASFGSRNIIEIPIKITTPSGLFSDIRLQIGGIATFNKSKRQKTFENSLEISMGIKGDLGWKTGIKNSQDLTLQVSKIMNLIKKRKIIEGSLPIAGGLINLRPFVDFEANLKGGINGTFAVGFGYRLGYKCGWTEKGFFHKNTSTEPNVGSIFNSFKINGKGQIGPEAVFHLGCGLYTKDLAVLLNVRPSLMIGAELGISGQKNNGKWQIQGQSVNLDIAVGIDGEITASLFGKDIYHNGVNFANINIFNKRFPIFPEIQSGSFDVWKSNKDPLVFKAEYSVTGGVIAKLLGGRPTIRVEKSGYEVYHIVDGQKIYYSAPSHLQYKLTGLSKNTTYTAIPSIMIGGMSFDWNGMSFSYKEEEEPEEIIPEDIQEKIDDYMPIYEGINPPNVEGTFIVSPNVTIYCEDGGYKPGRVIDDYYYNFLNQDMKNNTIDCNRWSQSGNHNESGNGMFIRGTGNNFTIFMHFTGVENGISIKTAHIISGTKSQSGIKNLKYALVMLGKGPDPLHKLMDVGVFRSFKDGNGISESITTESYNNAPKRQNAPEDNVNPFIKGKYYLKEQK